MVDNRCGTPVILHITAGDVGVFFLGYQKRLSHPEILNLGDVSQQLGHCLFVWGWHLANLRLRDSIHGFHYRSVRFSEHLLQFAYSSVVCDHIIILSKY